MAPKLSYNATSPPPKATKAAAPVARKAAASARAPARNAPQSASHQVARPAAAAVSEGDRDLTAVGHGKPSDPDYVSPGLVFATHGVHKCTSTTSSGGSSFSSTSFSPHQPGSVFFEHVGSCLNFMCGPGTRLVKKQDGTVLIVGPDGVMRVMPNGVVRM